MTDERREAVDDDVDVFEAEAAGQALVGRWIELPHAGLLTVEDADRLLRRRSAMVVAVVGERNGGKTTLMAELFERYLRGPFAGLIFTDSWSVLGFESKSFQSRADTGADVPDTPRTSKRDGLKFFHLALSDENLARSDLLISERAGEAYRDVRDRPSEASQILEVHKADKVVFVLDGERVADQLRRSEAIASVRHLARAFSESGAISESSEVQLVTTKWDLLSDGTMTAAREALDAFESQFVAIYEGRFAKASTFRVSARDPKGVMEAGFGLAAVLRSWFEPTPAKKSSPPPLPRLADEFDRLLVRKEV